MSQLLDYTKKLTKNRENRKIIFGSELSKANNEPTFRLHKKITKIEREKIEKNIFKFLAQNCLNRITILDYTKRQKSRNYFWLRIV